MQGLPATKDCILYDMIRLFETPRAGKSRETEETLGVARGLRGLGKTESDPNRYRGSFWGDDHILKPTVVRAPQLCECTKTMNVRFKQVNAQEANSLTEALRGNVNSCSHLGAAPDP